MIVTENRIIASSLEIVLCAIKALKERDGSALSALEKYMRASDQFGGMHNIRMACKQGLSAGLLEQVRYSYKLTPKGSKMVVRFLLNTSIESIYRLDQTGACTTGAIKKRIESTSCVRFSMETKYSSSGGSVPTGLVESMREALKEGVAIGRLEAGGGKYGLADAAWAKEPRGENGSSADTALCLDSGGGNSSCGSASSSSSSNATKVAHPSALIGLSISKSFPPLERFSCPLKKCDNRYLKSRKCKKHPKYQCIDVTATEDWSFKGTITAHDSDEGLWKVTYEDGDEEEMTAAELRQVLPPPTLLSLSEEDDSAQPHLDDNGNVCGEDEIPLPFGFGDEDEDEEDVGGDDNEEDEDEDEDDEQASFAEEEIGNKLNQLAMDKYWNQFEDGVSAAAAVAASNEDVDDLDSFEDTLSAEMNIFITEVQETGWIMKDIIGLSGCDHCGGWGCKGCEDPGVFVRLPPEVAKLGRVNTNFSCMLLGLRNGVWRPLLGGASGDFDRQVFANVYLE